MVDERLQQMRKRRAVQQLEALGYDVSLQPAQSARECSARAREQTLLSKAVNGS
ncbi:MAG: hypothetical protein PVS3B3_37510 [Ktedonobacteraceae bacterium]